MDFECECGESYDRLSEMDKEEIVEGHDTFNLTGYYEFYCVDCENMVAGLVYPSD